ncbi:MAG: glycoside hydrolase 100 family protein [Cyanobacteria bacterium P01_A01_bin.135]
MEYAQTLEAGWDALRQSMSIISYQGQPVGTVAASDTTTEALNYDQCFTRDFAISALAFLLKGEADIVRHFLKTTLKLQSHEKRLSCFNPGMGVMPASFKVLQTADGEQLDVDFGEQAIARVAPIDAVFWWLILLRAYTKATQDTTFASSEEVQEGMRIILDLCLTNHFNMFPTLLVPDGSFMVDRRMGVYGYPLDIQVLFFAALRSAKELLQPTPENKDYIEVIDQRLSRLAYYVRQYYWLDLPQLRQIYRYDSEEFGYTAMNQFNIQAEAIPRWVEGWVARSGGYFVGNLGPGRMDFRWFTQGNLLSTVVALAEDEQSHAIFNQLEERWLDLVNEMPLKVCFPALEGRDWELVTGHDPKNVPWSYHNAGSWPFMLVWLAAAAVKLERTEVAHRAMAIAAERLADDKWPEYYDGYHGRLIGKEARLLQTWTIAGFLAAHQLLQSPEKLAWLSFEGTVAAAC